MPRFIDNEEIEKTPIRSENKLKTMNEAMKKMAVRQLRNLPKAVAAGAIFCTTLGLSGCVAGIGQPQITYIDTGKIVGTRNVEIKDATLETLGGSIVGGVLGNILVGNSSSTNKNIGTAVGATLGGLIGNSLTQKDMGQELLVQIGRKQVPYIIKDGHFEPGDCVIAKHDGRKILSVEASACPDQRQLENAENAFSTQPKAPSARQIRQKI